MNDATLAEWLALRERADHRARSAAVTRAVAARLPAHRAVQVLDLATGTGANVRHLLPHLPARQRWMAVDRSPLLLSALAARTSEWARAAGHRANPMPDGVAIAGQPLDCLIETRRCDLRRLDDDMFARRDLVTASALLDLVSRGWLQVLAARCRQAGAVVLLALTYDGRVTCSPAEPEDEMIRSLVNRHQRRDAGLGGVAEGPDAAFSAARALEAEGYRVEMAASDWRLGPRDAAVQRALIDGWAEAARELAPQAVEIIASWRARRLRHVDAGRSRITVGHRDVAAWL